MIGTKTQTSAEVSAALDRELTEALAHPSEIFGFARYGDGKSWVRLDKMTGGLQLKSFDVLAARPKVGKSMLAAGWLPFVAEQAMNEGKVVRVITLEMTWEAYQRRAASHLAQIPNPMNIRRGLLSVVEQKRYRNALSYLAALPIEYLSNQRDLDEDAAMRLGGSSVTFADVNRFVSDGATYWWLLDHIGLLNDLSPDGDITKSIYSLANKLAGLAHREATGLVITHLTRASAGSRPTIESIAGSDQVGRNADKIFLLSRPWLDGELDDDDRELIKEGEPAFLQVHSRDEGSGLDVLWWDAELASFSEMDIEPGAKVPMPAKKTRR